MGFKKLGIFSALGVTAALALSGVFAKTAIADDATKKAPAAHEAQKIAAIPVTYLDTRKKDFSEEAIMASAKIASGRNEAIVFVYYANGDASEDPLNTPVKELDPKDGTVYSEIKAAVQRLIHEGYPAGRIILANSYSGNDDVDVFIEGILMKPGYEGVKAGHGALIDIITSDTKERWEMLQDVKRELALKKREQKEKQNPKPEND